MKLSHAEWVTYGPGLRNVGAVIWCRMDECVQQAMRKAHQASAPIEFLNSAAEWVRLGDVFTIQPGSIYRVSPLWPGPPKETTTYTDIAPHLSYNNRWHVTHNATTTRLEKITTGFNGCLGFVYTGMKNVFPVLQYTPICNDDIIIGYKLVVPDYVRYES